MRQTFIVPHRQSETKKFQFYVDSSSKIRTSIDGIHAPRAVQGIAPADVRPAIATVPAERIRNDNRSRATFRRSAIP